ncbi:MAG: hypothetical protein Q9191_004424 [Dirinaria sp. TL-2023a]
MSGLLDAASPSISHQKSSQRAEPEWSEGREQEARSVDVVETEGSQQAEEVMPGVLIEAQDTTKRSKMSNPAVNGRFDDTAPYDHPKAMPEALSNGNRLTNGDHELPNGVYSKGDLMGMAQDQSPPINGVEGLLGGQLPPEIEHITFGYLPLSSLIKRLAQETFNGLNEVVNDMSEQTSSQASNYSSSGTRVQVNGANAEDASQRNVQKKLRMLEFAQQRRQQFIKTLVLSQWSRQAEQVGKCIDLKVWLDGQRRVLNDAVAWTGELKRVVEPTKLQNPDIQTALEALSLGRALWLPDLNYLPLRKMTAKELLKAFRRINTLLSVRLNIEETIPFPLRDFSIRSGRATFRVKDEFELDLSIADQDPSSQLFFVDFRFIFSPAASEIPMSQIRDQIELKVNELLRSKGLSGCFDFLHDLVLTHKLSILRQEASALARGHWSDHIRVEAVHRSVVVQYWIQRPGGRNWVEIGVRRGEEKHSNSLQGSRPVPQIALRWFRAGKEVLEPSVDLSLGDLSLAYILEQVIAKHTSSIFAETTRALRAEALYGERVLKLKQNSSVKEPTEASLLIQLTPSKAIKIVQEPVTGRFAVLPASQLNMRMERDLNRLASPATEATSRIANLRCVSVQSEFDEHARCAGWEPVRSLHLDREVMQRFFPDKTLRISFFRKKAWAPGWVLALTTSLMGDATWIVQTIDQNPTTENAGASVKSGPALRAALKIPSKALRALLVDPSFENLANIERVLVGMISQYLNTRHLTMEGIPHKLDPFIAARPDMRTARLCIRFPAPSSGWETGTPPPVSKACRNDMIALDYHGIDPPSSSGIHIAAARIHRGIAGIKSLAASLSSTLAFHPRSGAFAFRLITPVGTTTIPGLLDRLSTVERLFQCLSIIQHRRLVCEIISLTRLSFTYHSNPSMKAVLDLPPGKPMQLSFDSSSPHLRIQDALNIILRAPDGGLMQALLHLDTTLPLLRQLSHIETLHQETGDWIDILPRSAEWFELRYHDPKCRINITLRRRQHGVKWFVQHLAAQKGEAANEDLAAGMKELFKGQSEGWQGLKSGIAASATGIQELLERIDSVCRSARKTATTGVSEEKPPTDPPNPRKRKAEGEVVVLD